MLLQFVVLVVALGGIIRDVVDHDNGSESDNGGVNADGAPRLFGILVVDFLIEGEENRSHDELGHTTAKITPSTAKSVSSSDDFLAEHAGGPVLAHHKCTTGRTDEETEDGEAGGSFDKAGTCGRDGSKTQNRGHGDAGSPLVAGGSENESHKNSSAYTDNGGGPNLLLTKTEIILDFTEKGCDGKPDEEGNEKSPPRHVKGSHVRSSKGTKLDTKLLFYYTTT